jgi:undecaprenyl diphosphate synthase
MADKTNSSQKKLKHLAIIMDGNGRWAKKHGLKRVEGHKAGEKTVRRVLDLVKEHNIEYLTLYAFSTENWKRSAEEVSALMHLLSSSIENNLREMDEKGLKIRLSGRIEGLPLYVRKKLQKAVKKTSENKEGTLILALNYGGRAEITDAVRKIAEFVKQSKLKPEDIDEKIISAHMYLPDVPDPDLLIRTSGEYRTSNFLMWESAYTELWFTDTLWPDFDREDFEKALDSFYNRERRFGGRKC